MKKLVRIVGISLLLLGVLIAGALSYVKFGMPGKHEFKDFQADTRPDVIERGKYLANNVAVCMDCHSTRDWSKFSGPLVEGTLGKGGERFDQAFGFPGSYHSKNITPGGVGKWTNAELEQAITTGVSRDGHALFPIMPYPHYAKADEEDIKAIIAYIRTLPAIEYTPETSVSDFPMNFIINTIPAPPQFRKRPTDEIAYGEYLVNMASCITCHSKEDKGELIAGTEFGGGREFPIPGMGLVRSANISPDASGIGDWTREAFIRRFKAYAPGSYVPHNLQKGEMQTVMPWTMYAGMSDSDLGSIYEYLRTVKPVKNNVEKFVAAN